MLDDFIKRGLTHATARAALEVGQRHNNPGQRPQAAPPNQVFKVEPGIADDVRSGRWTSQEDGKGKGKVDAANIFIRIYLSRRFLGLPRFKKHFWPHEVLETGQHLGLHVEELVDRCFVMFYTRFTEAGPKI